MTVKQLIKLLGKLEDKDIITVWGSIDDDGTGWIRTNKKNIKVD